MLATLDMIKEFDNRYGAQTTSSNPQQQVPNYYDYNQHKHHHHHQQQQQQHLPPTPTSGHLQAGSSQPSPAASPSHSPSSVLDRRSSSSNIPLHQHQPPSSSASTTPISSTSTLQAPLKSSEQLYYYYPPRQAPGATVAVSPPLEANTDYRNRSLPLPSAMGPPVTSAPHGHANATGGYYHYDTNPPSNPQMMGMGNNGVMAAPNPYSFAQYQHPVASVPPPIVPQNSMVSAPSPLIHPLPQQQLQQLQQAQPQQQQQQQQQPQAMPMTTTSWVPQQQHVIPSSIPPLVSHPAVTSSPAMPMKMPSVLGLAPPPLLQSTMHPHHHGPLQGGMIGGHAMDHSSRPPSHLMTTFNSKLSMKLSKKHVCTLCGKPFTRPSSLQTHMYSHTGEKPFKCDFDGCGRQFSVVSNLRRHKKIHGIYD